MTSDRELTREVIVRALVDALKPLDYVYALWEGGAAAFDRVDDWSDIDLYTVVNDKRVDDTFLAVENTLKSLSPIRQKHVVLEPPLSGLSQAFYRLQDTSPYLIIDLAVFKLSSPDKLLETEIHGNPVFYFNKSNKVKQSELNKDELIKKLQETVFRLKDKFDMFHIFVQKEINRSNHLEAIDIYRMLLAWLVKVLRIRYNPLHYDFGMRYVHYELPSETVKKLERLHFVKDDEDLQQKYNEVVEWFSKAMSEIDNEQIERLITMA